VLGLSLAGAYRTFSTLSKAKSVDLSEQVHETVVAHPAEIELAKQASDDAKDTVVRGFTGEGK
jgi:hypothetical protein